MSTATNSRVMKKVVRVQSTRNVQPKNRNRKAPTRQEEHWEPVKARVIELYDSQGLPVRVVKARIEEEFEAINFTATERQYKLRLSQWGYDKNVKPKEMRIIAHKSRQRELLEPQKNRLRFRLRGHEIADRKINRWIKKNSDNRAELNPPSPGIETPDALSSWTASEPSSPNSVSLKLAPFIVIPARPPRTSPGSSTKHRTSRNSLSSSLWDAIFARDPAVVGQSPRLSSIQMPSLRAHFAWFESAIAKLPESLHISPLRTEQEVSMRSELGRLEEQWGWGHVKTMDVLKDLGWIAFERGQYRSAGLVLGRVLMTCEAHLGVEHRLTLEALWAFAVVLRDQGQYDRSELLHRLTLDARARVNGLEHDETLASLQDLASVIAQRGQYQEACAMLRTTLDAHKKIHGPRHLNTLRSMSRLVETLARQNRLTEAVALGYEAVEVATQTLGQSDINVLGAKHRLAVAIHTQGENETAEVIVRQLLHDSKQSLGSEHPNHLATMQLFGNILDARGELLEAEAVYIEVRNIRLGVLGPEHPNTLWAVWGLASNLANQARRDEALALYDQVLSGFKEAVGTDHPYWQNCRRDYDKLLQDE